MHGMELQLSDRNALALIGKCSEELIEEAHSLTVASSGGVVSYSKKVFIPLTQLCRDVCHYCVFAKTPPRAASPFLSVEQAVEIARKGKDAGCKEALFTLGDQPERRYPAARHALDEMGFRTTLEYLEAVAEAVYRSTGLLPHLNPGVMDSDAIGRLRRVSVSMGIML